MGGRLVILIFTAALFAAACGPRYAIYNGGLVPYEGEEEPEELQPTEAVAAFSTDYAPPSQNTLYGGPTNRVRVMVREDVESRFLAVSSTKGVTRMTQSLPVRGRSGQAALAGHLGSTPARALAQPSRPEALSQGRQGMKVSAIEGSLGNVERDTHVTEQESANVALSAASRGLAGHASDAASLALDGSSALRHPVGVDVAAAADRADAPMRYQGTGSPSGYAGPSTLSQNTDVAVPHEEVHSEAARDIGKPGSTLPVENVAAAAENRVSTNAATGSRPGGAKGFEDTRTGTLLAHRDTAAYVAGSDARISAGTSEAAAVRKQTPLAHEMTQRLAGRQKVTSESAKARGGTQNSLALSQAEAAAFKKDPKAFMRTLAVEAIETRGSTSALRSRQGVMVPREVSFVSPPRLAVWLVGRLMDEADIARLVENGVIEKAPEKRLIQYRFYVFNPGMSVAADVRIVNRLDDSTPFFAATAGEAGKVVYDPAKHTVTAAAPELQSLEGVIFEFYVEVR